MLLSCILHSALKWLLPILLFLINFFLYVYNTVWAWGGILLACCSCMFIISCSSISGVWLGCVSDSWSTTGWLPGVPQQTSASSHWGCQLSRQALCVLVLFTWLPGYCPCGFLSGKYECGCTHCLKLWGIHKSIPSREKVVCHDGLASQVCIYSFWESNIRLSLAVK